MIKSNGIQAFPGDGRERGGLSGNAIFQAGLEMVKSLCNIRDQFHYKYKVIGIGGVQSYNDYKQYKDAGADIVMSATGALYNPFLAQEIKEGSLS